MFKVNKTNLFHKLSIRYKIIFMVVLIALLPMMISAIYFYINFSSVLNNIAYNNLSEVIDQVNINIESSFDNIDTTTSQLISNPTILSNVMNPDAYTEYYSKYFKQNDIESELKYTLLFNTAWNDKLISSVYLFDNNFNHYSISQSKKSVQTVDENNTNIYQRFSLYNGRDRLIISPSKNDSTIYFLRNIFDINNGKVYYKLILGMDEKVLSQKYKTISKYPGTKALIFDENGTIFSSIDNKSLGDKVDEELLNINYSNKISQINYENEKYFIAAEKIKNSSLTFAVMVPKQQILLNLSQTINKFLLIIFCIFIVGLLTSLFISTRFTNIINDFLRGFNLVNKGNYDTKLPNYNDRELNQLSSTFNSMTSEIKYLINEVYEKQLILKETEFKFLQSQMNPHFLFNILTTISWRAKLSNDESIYKMITSLSELLQASIYTNNFTQIPIREELEYIEFYLYLQKIRFDDRLNYVINVADESILDCYLPKLTVEPIVENAVVHGIENKIGSGTITLNIKRSNDSIYFEIIDNGIGFDPEKINLQQSDYPKEKDEKHNGIGLKNLNRRIKLIYGEQYGISIKSEKNHGAQVTLHIPIDRGGLNNV